MPGRRTRWSLDANGPRRLRLKFQMSLSFLQWSSELYIKTLSLVVGSLSSLSLGNCHIRKLFDVPDIKKQTVLGSPWLAHSFLSPNPLCLTQKLCLTFTAGCNFFPPNVSTIVFALKSSAHEGTKSIFCCRSAE